jgi:hypothetical protein
MRVAILGEMRMLSNPGMLEEITTWALLLRRVLDLGIYGKWHSTLRRRQVKPPVDFIFSVRQIPPSVDVPLLGTSV